MANYIFTTNYGQCSITDPETGVTVEWKKGRFNETNRASVDPISKLNESPDALTIARVCREIADYALENYTEII